MSNNGEHKKRLFEIKISQYADDSSLYLPSKHSIKLALSKIEVFS